MEPNANSISSIDVVISTQKIRGLRSHGRLSRGGGRSSLTLARFQTATNVKKHSGAGKKNRTTSASMERKEDETTPSQFLEGRTLSAPEDQIASNLQTARAGSSTLPSETVCHTGGSKSHPILHYGASTRTNAPIVAAPTDTFSRVFKRPSSGKDNRKY